MGWTLVCTAKREILYQMQEVVSSNPGDTGQTVGFSFEWVYIYILTHSNENPTVCPVSPGFELTTSCIWYRNYLLAAQTSIQPTRPSPQQSYIYIYIERERERHHLIWLSHQHSCVIAFLVIHLANPQNSVFFEILYIVMHILAVFEYS